MGRFRPFSLEAKRDKPMEDEQVKRIHERIDATNERVDSTDSKVEELRKDVKDHCKESDAKIRKVEEESFKQDFLLKQFIAGQKEQTEMMKNLNSTMSSFERTLDKMSISLNDLYTKHQENTDDICDVKNKVSENEKLHTVDIRETEKSVMVENLKKAKPYAIIIGLLGAGSALIYAFNQLFALINAIPK